MRRIPGAFLILSFFALPAWTEPIRITGRVESNGLPEVRVELMGYPRGSADQLTPPVTARPAPEDGSFELTAPAPGLYRLTVRAEGALRSEVVPVVDETTDLWLGLGPGEVARRPMAAGTGEERKGRVLDAVTQAPLAGALVWQAGLDAGEDVPWTWTAADGSFRLALRGPDPAIGAAAAGYLPVSLYSLSVGGPLALTLLPAGTLTGQIVDPQGRPVAGAVLHASPTEIGTSGREGRHTRSKADGRFLLRGLTPERGYRLFVNAEGFVFAWDEVTLGKPGQATPPVRIVLSPGVTLIGRLVDPDGQPVAGADLSLRTAAEGPEQSGFSMSSQLKASSAATGRFRFEHVGKGAYSLQVVRPGFAPARRSGTVGAPRQGVVDLGDLILERGAVIEGRVTDRHGTPVEGAQILVHSRLSDRMHGFAPRDEPTLTGPDGSFRIGDLEGGRSFHLMVHKAGYVMARMPGVEAPTKELLEIELQAGRSLSGRVTDAERRPVQGASVLRVEMEEVGTGEDSSFGRSSGEVGQTDEEGRFVLSGLEPGPLHLAFAAPGFRTTELSGLRIPEEGEAAPLDIILQKGVVLEGRVLDGKGQPAGRAYVEVRRSEADRSFSPLVEVTDESGHYRIDGLGPGEHQVEARVLGGFGRYAEGKVVLGDSGTYRLDLRLPSGVDVSGSVLDEQGEPLRGAGLSLQPIQQDGGRSGFWARSAADGSFRFQDVPDGTYRLSGSASGHVDPMAPEEVLVSGREVGGLVLRLARGGTITGRVLGIDEETRRMLRINALREDGTASGTFIQGTTYELTVAPGTWRVTASLPSGLTASGTTSVGVGEKVVLDLEIPRGLTLSGQVLLDGQPLAGARIHGTGSPQPGADGGPVSGAIEGTTRYDGTFSLSGLLPGHVTLAVISRGVYHSRSLDLTKDQTVTIEIFTGQVSGVVLSSSGEPIEGVLLVLRGEDRETGGWAEAARASTDERGAFTVPRLAAGSYRITAEGEGLAPAAQTLVVTPGGTTEIQVVLKPQ